MSTGEDPEAELLPAVVWAVSSPESTHLLLAVSALVVKSALATMGLDAASTADVLGRLLSVTVDDDPACAEALDITLLRTTASEVQARPDELVVAFAKLLKGIGGRQGSGRLADWIAEAGSALNG